jgi:rubrerythrin
MAKLKQESVADFLHCASILEERAYLLYKSLADKVNLPLINSLMLHIAFDSRKHSVILKAISESIAKPKKQHKNCEKKLFFGGTWAMIEHLAGDVATKGRIPREHMSSLVEKLMLLESTVAGEYYILVQLKTLRYMTREIREIYNVDLEDLKDILETIIRDEEIHRELLSKMKKILTGDEKQTKDIAPAIKYKNPDAWLRSAPDLFCENTR